jgi:hypothetical protein
MLGSCTPPASVTSNSLRSAGERDAISVNLSARSLIDTSPGMRDSSIIACRTSIL